MKKIISGIAFISLAILVVSFGSPKTFAFDIFRPSGTSFFPDEIAFIPERSSDFRSLSDREIASISEGPSDFRLLPERIVYIHHKKDFANHSPRRNSRASRCYAVLSKGAKLKTTEDLVIHPSLILLNPLAVINAASEWDTHTQTSLFGSAYVDETANWDDVYPDGRNEFSFGNYSDPSVIAVTVVWGYFSGPPRTKQILEFDVLFDTDFVWGDAEVNPTVMDLQNIATHEIGHGVGLDDVYESACSEVTMYGYSDYGEIKKRTLEVPDIKGLQSLYGS